jgi:hypothetical protein
VIKLRGAQEDETNPRAPPSRCLASFESSAAVCAARLSVAAVASEARRRTHI